MAVKGGINHYAYTVNGSELIPVAGGVDGEPLPDYYLNLGMPDSTKNGLFNCAADLSAYAGQTVIYKNKHSNPLIGIFPLLYWICEMFMEKLEKRLDFAFECDIVYVYFYTYTHFGARNNIKNSQNIVKGR